MKKYHDLLVSGILGISIALVGSVVTIIANQTTATTSKIETSSNSTTIYLNSNSKTQSYLAKTAPEEQSATITNLDAVKMLNPNDGWAWGYEGGNFKLIKTNNGGQTWGRIDLPIEPPQFDAENNQGIVSVYFLDGQYGWISWSKSKNSSLTILRTKDGGQNWEELTASVPNTVAIVNKIEFVNPKRGWILCSSQYGLSGTQKFLFSTEDGGESWHNLTANNFLPYAGTLTDINFINDTDGWLTVGNPASANVFLLKTTDGGKTWSDKGKSIPIPKEDQNMDAVFVEAPIFSPPGNEEGILLVSFYTENKRHPVLYLTENSGETWTSIAMEKLVNSFVNRKGLPAFFLNTKEGWSFKEGVIYGTTNSGKTWTLIPSKTLSDALKKYPKIEQMEFVNRQVGWLILSSQDSSHSRLLKTTDGGITWIAQ